jgi:hypothetical protein
VPTRASKSGKKRDFTQIAKAIIDEVTGNEDRSVIIEELTVTPPKNPHAQALSALGASKGGKARAKKLSANKRKSIARKAARARWQKG